VQKGVPPPKKGASVKTFAACVATALAVLVGTSAFANAGGQAVTPKQFAALAKRVTAVEKTEKTVVGYVGQCFSRWAPVSRYGPGGNEGFVYVFPDGSLQAVAALDINHTGDTADFYVPAPTADCSLTSTQLRSLSVAVRGAARTANFVPHSR
jgi:hypothetical protein